MHIAGVAADPATFEHIDPAAVGNAREVLVSELSGKGTLIGHAGGELAPEDAARVVERVKELEHRGFQFEAADGSLDLLIRRETGDYEPLFRLESWRVIAEKREDGRVMTEATIKIWVEGERFVRTAEGNGPVHALDQALRDAISETYPHLADIKLVNYKVRILDESKATGGGHARAARRLRRHGHLGRDRRARERDRGELGRARGLAGGRHAAEPLGPPPRRAHGRRVSVDTDIVPMAQPVLGEEEERAVIEVLRSGQLSLGPRIPEFERRFAERLGVAARERGLLRHRPRCTSGCGRSAWGRATRSSPRRSRSWPRPTRSSTRAPRRCSPTSTRARSTSTPAAAAAAITERTSALLPVHIFGYPADLPALEAHGLPIVEDACEALGAVHADGTPVGGRGHPAAFGFYANKQLTTGEGGMLTLGSAEHKARVDSERNQGRAPDMGWLDHDRLGFNYRLTDIQAAIGLCQLDRLDGMLADRAKVAGLVSRGARRPRGARAALRGRRRRRARLVRVRRPGPARRATATP